VNENYALTEKIIAEAVNQSVPVDVISKGRYSDDAIRLMARQKGCIGQVTMLTPREELQKRLMQGAATTEELFENVRRLRRAGVFTIVRIDPVIPGLTDDLDDLRNMMKDVSAAGAQHVIVSAMRIPYRMKERIFQDLSALGVDGKYARELYTDWYDGSVHPKWDYRKPLFDELSAEAKRRGMTFALCREFVKEEGKLVGLNGRYCTAESCEGEKYVLESQSQRVSESEIQ
jgi:DNA repair photolyase